MLAENGIFTGEKLGDKYFFKPDTAVTLGEFLAMCPRPDDIEPLSGITALGMTLQNCEVSKQTAII